MTWSTLDSITFFSSSYIIISQRIIYDQHLNDLVMPYTDAHFALHKGVQDDFLAFSSNNFGFFILGKNRT
jgi:hypothetical protein